MNKYILFAGAALFALAACGGADASDAQANVATAADANAADAHGEEGGGPNVLLEANAILPAGTEESRIAFGANSLDTIEQDVGAAALLAMRVGRVGVGHNRPICLGVARVRTAAGGQREQSGAGEENIFVHQCPPCR